MSYGYSSDDDYNYNKKSLRITQETKDMLSTLPDDLEILYCDDMELDRLPSVLPSHLEELYCHDNNLTTLPELPRGLTILHCENNRIGKLPELPDALRELHCGNNELTEIPALPELLSTLRCHGNDITNVVRFPTDEDSYIVGLDIELLNLRSLKAYKAFMSVNRYENNEVDAENIFTLQNIDRRIQMLSRQSISGRRRASGVKRSVKKRGSRRLKKKSVRKKKRTSKK
jgi:Leucine-rich repeat (LRR) protein